MGPSNDDRTRREITETRYLPERLEALASDMSSVRLHTKEPGRNRTVMLCILLIRQKNVDERINISLVEIF